MEDDDFDSQGESLLPGIPNHLAHRCLTSLHPSLLYHVSRSWRRLIYSPSFPPFFSLYALLSPSIPTNNLASTSASTCPSPFPSPFPSNALSTIHFFCFEPISSTWHRLPPPPPEQALHLQHRHPSFLSRNMAIQSLAVAGNLAVVAATDVHLHPALPCPLIFNPGDKKWLSGPPLSVPRRWCVAGSLRGVVYITSGVGSHYRADVARSLEKWDVKRSVNEWKWETKEGFRDGRFSREAVEAIGYRGKLCMVNVKGHAVKEGAIYDADTSQWADMPLGMVAGWNGPAATAEEETMYAIDELSGALSKYDDERDRWEVVIVSEILKGAEQMAAGRGRVCVVCAKGKRIAVVDVVAETAKLWVVRPPPGFEVVALHVLPRMSR